MAMVSCRLDKNEAALEPIAEPMRQLKKD